MQENNNVVPSECDLVIDIRNDCYSNPEILEVVKEHVDAEVTPMHLASSIPEAHGLVQELH
jgi:acetylornithine deacetylase